MGFLVANFWKTVYWVRVSLYSLCSESHADKWREKFPSGKFECTLQANNGSKTTDFGCKEKIVFKIDFQRVACAKVMQISLLQKPVLIMFKIPLKLISKIQIVLDLERP